MKKIFSLLLVVSMLCAMMITTNAAYTMGFTADKTSVKVGETFAVTLNIDLTDGVTTAGGSIVLNYDPAYATLVSITEGTMTAGASNWVDLGTAKANKTFTTAIAESGTFCVATFEAVAPTDAFVVSAKTVSFTFRNPTKRESNAANVGAATVKIAGDEFVPETIEGTEVAAAATDIELDKDPATSYKNQYVGTAVFNATLGADVKYGEAGFIWVKDGVKTENKFAVDAKAITGNGTFDYGVAMYAIPAGVTITAIPYYVTAE